jgi:hypothetical protein
MLLSAYAVLFWLGESKAMLRIDIEKKYLVHFE